MIGELISAGATLLGGLFGRKKQKTENSVDYVKMANSAKAAGFNPLTALRNGGSAGFTTTTGPTMSALPEALASMGGILGGALQNKLDPLEQKKRQYDTALVDYQLRQLKEGPKAMPGTLYSGSQFFGAKVTSASPIMSGTSKGFQGPPMPEHLKLGIGKEMPMYVWVVDDRGKRHRLPNPDLPELDQMAVPTAGILASELAEAGTKLPNKVDAAKFRLRNGNPWLEYYKATRRKNGGGGW